MVSNNRKLMLINPRFQLVFMGFMIAVSAVAIGVFYSANFFFFSDFIKTGQSLGLPPDHVFFKFLENQRQTMNQIFMATSAACFLLLTVGGLVFSHRVAGPLYRLHKHMLAVASGETKGTVKFRTRDFFPEIADAYNAQLATLKGETQPKSDDKSKVA